MNFSNQVNELFHILSRLNEMADLILVEDICVDDWIKSLLIKQQNIYNAANTG